MTIVGTVEIVAAMDTSKVEGELKAGTAPAFAKFEEQSKVSGRVAGEEMGASMRAGLEPAFAEMEAQAATSGELSGMNLRTGMAKHTAALEGDLEKSGSKAGEGLVSGLKKQQPEVAGVMGEMGEAGGAKFAAAAAVGIAGYAVHLGLEMAKADTAIAQSAQVSQAQAKKIGDAFLNTGGKAEFSGNQMAQAYAPVAAQLRAIAGHSLAASDATKVMLASAALAEGKQIDLKVATGAVATVMQTYGLHANEAARVSDVLFKASGATGVSVDQLAGQMQKLHGKLGDTAPNMSQTAGLLQEMTAHGITGRAAMTGLTSGLTTVQTTGEKVLAATKAEREAFDAMPPSLQRVAKAFQAGDLSKKAYAKATSELSPVEANLITGFNRSVKSADAAQQKYRDLGVTVFDSKGKFEGMGSIIEQLHPQFAKMNQEQQLTAASSIFGAGAAKQMTVAIDAGSTSYAKATNSVHQMGAAHEAAEKQAATLEGQMHTLEAELNDIATVIGEALIPPLTKLVGWFVDGIKYVADFKDHWKTLAEILVAPFGPAAAAAVYFKDQVVGAFHTVESTVTGVWDTIESSASSAWTTVSGDASTAWAAVSGTAKDAYHDVKVGANDVVTFFSGLPGKIGGAIGGTFDGLYADFAKVVNAIINAWDGLHFKLNIPSINTHIPGIGKIGGGSITVGVPHVGDIPSALAAGGVVTGPTNALIGEAGTHEAVLPLNAAMFSSLGESIAGAMTHSGANPTVTQWAADAQKASLRYGIPASILLADIQQESGGRTGLVSPTGAQGITQFEPATARQYGVNFGTGAAAVLTQVMGQAHYLADLGGKTNITSALEGYFTGTPGQAGKGGAQYAASVLAQVPAYRSYDRTTGTAGSVLPGYAPGGTTPTHVVSVAATDADITKWAKSMVGHFAESTGQNTGPELDKLQKEFGTRAAQWCAMFATTAADMGGASKAVRSASVDQIAAWAKAGTHGYTKGLHTTAKVGDLALEHGASGYHGHVGFVVAVNKAKGTYTTEEGNANGAGGVITKVHPMSDNEGFARPIYAATTKTLAAAAESAKKTASAESAAVQKGAASVVALQKQENADSHTARVTTTNLVVAANSNSLAFLNTELNATHEKALQKTEDALVAQGTKSAEKLEGRLVAAHKDALAQQTKLQAAATAAATKQFLQGWAAALDQQAADALNAKTSVDNAVAAKTLKGIQDQSKLNIDAVNVKAGAAGALDQANVDFITKKWDDAISDATVKAAMDAAASPSVQAADAAYLAQLQNSASIEEAQYQATLDLDTAITGIAQQAAGTSTDTTNTTGSDGGATSATTTPPATTTNLTLQFYGVTDAKSALSEVDWAITTGTLPIPPLSPVAAA